MASLESLKCPECGAPLSFTNDQEYCYCSHCGHQVYKEDVHYDRRMDYEEKKLEVDKEIELKRLEQAEMTQGLYVAIGAAGLLLFIALICILTSM